MCCLCAYVQNLLTPTFVICLTGVDTYLNDIFFDRCQHWVSTPMKILYALVGVDTLCQHWVSTPTEGDTALEGVDTYQSIASFGKCQHLP